MFAATASVYAAVSQRAAGDVADLLILAQHCGRTGATQQDGDFNEDGRVDFTDLLLLAKHYG